MVRLGRRPGVWGTGQRSPVAASPRQGPVGAEGRAALRRPTRPPPAGPGRGSGQGPGAPPWSAGFARSSGVLGVPESPNVVPLHSVPSGSPSLALRAPRRTCAPNSFRAALRDQTFLSPGKGGNSLTRVSLRQIRMGPVQRARGTAATSHGPERETDAGH